MTLSAKYTVAAQRYADEQMARAISDVLLLLSGESG